MEEDAIRQHENQDQGRGVVDGPEGDVETDPGQQQGEEDGVCDAADVLVVHFAALDGAYVQVQVAPEGHHERAGQNSQGQSRAVRM